MKIEIKLPDPKYCNGCPCLRASMDSADCHFMPLILERDYDAIPMARYIIRPQICKDKNGE